MDRTYTEHEVSSVAKELISSISHTGRTTIFALEGDLGAGKTTLTKAIAKELGVVDEVISPTFVIQKTYQTKNPSISKLVHIDAYRLTGEGDTDTLNLDETFALSHTLVIIEWPSLIEKELPDSTRWFYINHTDEKTRTIQEKHA